MFFLFPFDFFFDSFMKNKKVISHQADYDKRKSKAVSLA